MEQPYREPRYEAVEGLDDTVTIHDRYRDDGENWLSCPSDLSIDLYSAR